jgi:WD40 repeat protein
MLGVFFFLAFFFFEPPLILSTVLTDSQICSVEFDRKDIAMNKLLTTGLESKFSVFDLRTQHPKNGFAAVTTESHKSTIWCGHHLPQNRDVFVTSGGNGSLHVWKYKCVRVALSKVFPPTHTPFLHR